MNIGGILLKAIYNNLWVKIEYKKDDEITRFMIGINGIDTKKMMIICDAFNMQYNKDTQLNYHIFYEKIINAELCENTFHKTPFKLIQFIDTHKNELKFMNERIFKDDLFDYYIDCFKLDTVPYQTKYGLLPEIDNDVLLDYKSYTLNENQFNILAKDLFVKKNKKETNIETQTLGVNCLSINTIKGLYVLAYRPLLFDIKNKCLVVSKDIIINREFIFDDKIRNVRMADSIYKYFPEEKNELLDDFDTNRVEICQILNEYNNTNKVSSSYRVNIDTRPFIMCLQTNLIIDIEKEMWKIKSLYENNPPISLRVFIGESDSKLARRNNYPIFTVNDYYNIDQINAINIGMKSPVSYIQGPPGTGKTQTLLNAILTGLLNNKTILATSNNNIPMDGIYEAITKLKYKEKNELLFPAIRLGNIEYCIKALYKIRELYFRSLDLNVKENKIDKIKKESKEKLKNLIDLLDKNDKKVDLTNRLQSLELMNKKCNDSSFMKMTITLQINHVNEMLKQLGNISDEISEYMNNDYKKLFMAIHFETAGRLQKLRNAKYRDLYTIFIDINEDNKYIKAKLLRDYLQDENNFAKFLEIFPIVISTNLSCCYLGDKTPLFDIVMMDEAGQCNIANALIPISKGKQLMLVGDPQQLKPVIVLDKNINNKLKEKYHILDDYDYVKNSIYSTYTKIDIVNNETLLRSHYRCNSKIINFCNKKYYNNRLNLLSTSQEKTPLVYIDTSKNDNNQEKNISEIEAQCICDYIKAHKEQSIGIITPFVKQKECIEKYLKLEGIDDVSVGTVHAFQGDQKNVIMFSSAITNSTTKGTYAWLKNNRELINVAVSRAKDRFIMLGNKKAINELSTDSDDMKELAQYVNSNGESLVSNVSPKSFALGTRTLSKDGETELYDTVNQILSVINKNCSIKKECTLDSLTFDAVIFERTYSKNRPVVAIDLLSQDDYENNMLNDLYKQKEEYCHKNKIVLKRIKREYAREYYSLKSALKDIIG